MAGVAIIVIGSGVWVCALALGTIVDELRDIRNELACLNRAISKPPPDSPK